MDERILKELKDKDIFFFDFDGTLVETEELHMQAHLTILKKILGREAEITSQEFLKRYKGKQDDEIFEMYKKDFDVDFDKQKMIEEKIDIALNILRKAKLKVFDYFFEVLKIKKDKSFYILSNQTHKILFEMLKEKDIYKYFENIFCLPDLKVTKEFFLDNISNFLNLNNKKVVLFEDSNFALKKAKEKNILTIGVETEINAGSLKDADFIVRPFGDK